MRLKLPAVLALSAAALVVLSGCASNPETTSTTTPSASATSVAGKCTPPKSGSVSDAVTVTGAKGAEPKVTFDKPLKADALQRSYVTKGDGPIARVGSMVNVAVVAYNGTTGAKLTSTGFGSDQAYPYTVGDSTLVPGLDAAIECAPVGSLLVTTGSVKSAWGNGDPSALKLKATDSVVFVTDIKSMVPLKATGEPQTPRAGFPAVKLASSGKPTVTVPSTQPPSSLQIEVLKKGDGPAVTASGGVVLQYQGVNWRTGKVFDQSWGKDAPLQPTAVSGYIPGFTKALVGQTAGSQVLVVIPPADGYGTAGQPSAGIKGTDTLVFVVDILEAIG